MVSNSTKYVIFFIVLIGLIYSLSPVLMPFLIAALLAYLGNPLVNALESRKWRRTWAVSLVFAVIFIGSTVILIVLVPLIEQQITSLIEKVPAIIQWARETVLPWFQLRLDGLGTANTEQIQQTLQENIGRAGSILANVMGSISSSGLALLSGLANLILIPVVTFYLLRDWDAMLKHLQDIFPRRMEGKLTTISKEIDVVLGAFFKGQILVMLSLSVIYYLGLSIVGLEFALLIALLAGLVSFVPYLGLITGLALACGASIFQFHDASAILPILLVFGVAQVLESVALTPILVGDKIGLHPVAVIFAVMTGGHLFGFTGVLLALPVGAALLVVLRHANDQYKESELYSKT